MFQSWFVRLNVIDGSPAWGEALVVGVAAFERYQHSAPSPRRTERRRIDAFDVDGMATCTALSTTTSESHFNYYNLELIITFTPYC